MACTDVVCGTGGWTGPLPGDPDNNSILTATPAFGGIDVSWTYPAINPHAVAYTILYRGIIPDFAGATRRSTVAGSLFYDKTTVALPVKYYYWIQIVSVNGTVGALIGPASATARPTIEQTITDLTGKIDAGVLAQSLKTEIGNISLLGSSITKEVADRIAANTALLSVLGTTAAKADTAVTFINSEINQRKSADSAIVESLDLMAAGFGDSIAGLAEEIIIKAGPQSALAKKITTLEASVNGSTVTGQIGLSAEVDTLTGVIGGLYTAKISVDGLIGGFGIYNNGREVEAGFDVDRFWVGRTGATGRKPFIIENGEVFINEAAIANASITAAKIGSIALVGMDNFSVKSGNTDTRMEINSRSIKVYENGILRVHLGDLSDTVG